MAEGARISLDVITLLFPNSKGVWGEWNIRAESVKITLKQDNETYTASQRKEPYAISFGGTEYSIDLSGVDPFQRYLFDHILEAFQNPNQIAQMPRIKTFVYNKDGKLEKDYEFRQVYIEEISKENAEPFDVKMGALMRY